MRGREHVVGRPRTDEEVPVAKRLEDAFWELLAEKPIERIAVGALTEKAGCNRGTFYYHYRDMDDLMDKMIEENLPKEIPSFVLSCMMGLEEVGEVGTVVSQASPRIDRLCMLLNSKSSAYVAVRVKRAIVKLWEDTFGLDARSSVEVAVFFEFVVSGLMGVMAYRAETGLKVSIQEVFRSLSPEIPEALAARLRACQVASGRSFSQQAG